MIVYVLSDPRDGAIRYVGQTRRSLAVRVKSHLREAKTGAKRHVCAWLRSLSERPAANILSVCSTQADLDAAETKWIAALRAQGNDLTNAAPGGSVRSGWTHSEETRQKWRAERRSHKGSHFGHRHSDEVKELLRLKAIKQLADHGHHFAGKTHSAETRQKIKDAARFRRAPKQMTLPAVATHYRQVRAAECHTGRKRSPETIQRMREAAQRRGA